MKILEKSNSLIVKFTNEENLIEGMESTLTKYRIKEAWIRGFGLASSVDYGIVERVEPIFFKKIHIDELVTISSLTARIEGDLKTINFSGIGTNSQPHIGRLYGLIVASEFEIIIEILQTE